MARQIVSAELWEIIEPLIPKVERRYRYPGRRRVGVDGHPVRLAQRDPLGGAAEGNGLRLGGHLLAPAARVAAAGRLAAPSRGPAGKAQRRR